MNDRIRQDIRSRMKELNMTQADLGERIGMAQPNVQRLLAGRAAHLPDSWQKVLDVLQLELVVIPKEK